MNHLDLGRIDRIAEHLRPGFIQENCTKLESGQKIKLQGLEVGAWCKQFLSLGANPADLINLQSVITIQNIQAELQQYGLNIVHISIENGIYTIEATK